MPLSLHQGCLDLPLRRWWAGLERRERCQILLGCISLTGFRPLLSHLYPFQKQVPGEKSRRRVRLPGLPLQGVGGKGGAIGESRRQIKELRVWWRMRRTVEQGWVPSSRPLFSFPSAPNRSSVPFPGTSSWGEKQKVSVAKASSPSEEPGVKWIKSHTDLGAEKRREWLSRDVV